MIHGPDLRRDLRRDVLLRRAGSAQPRILVLSAPAGYGKSTFARQYSDDAATVVCDCSLARDLPGLARQLLMALAEGSPDRISFLAQSEIQTAFTDNASSDLAVQAWRVPCASSIFVFENAEYLMQIGGAMASLSKLLSVVPKERRVVICSRVRLPLRLARYFRPYDILHFDADDLRFGEAEFAELFDGGLPPAIVAKAYAVSGGWPMAAVLLARIGREGRLEQTISRLDDIAFEELHHYVVDEALGALPSALCGSMEIAALAPEPAAQDVSLAFDDKACANLRAYADSSPFVRFEGDRIHLHPMIGAALVQRCSERRQSTLISLAQRHENAQSFIRAAELYLAAGEQERAAQSLDAVSWLDRPADSMHLARIIGSLDRDVLLRFPQLWGVTIAYSRFAVDPWTAVAEARSILQRLGTLPADRLVHVVRPLAGYLSRLGMQEEGYRLICDFERAMRIPQLPRSINEAAVLYIRMMIAARLGKLNEALELAERVRPFILTHAAAASLFLIEHAAETLRPLGRRAEERLMLDEALRQSRSAGYGVNAGLALAEQSFGAWLAGEDEMFASSSAALDLCVQDDGVRGLWHYAAVARGNIELPPLGVELPKWLACANIVAACMVPDVRAAQRHAVSAREAADKYGSPFLNVLAGLLLAEHAPALRSERLAAVLETAKLVESAPLQKSLQAYVAGDDDVGMLGPFFARLRRDPAGRPLSHDVDLLRGEIVANGKRYAISDKKLALVAILGRSRQGLGRETIVETIWSDHEKSSAENAFNLCLHQLRKIVGDDTIALRHGVYTLDERVRVDLRLIEDYVTAVALRSELEDSQRVILARFYERLCEPLPKCYAQWEWFDATLRRIGELRCEIAARLARDALARGDPREGLRLARTILEYDDCDEPAREIAIRAYVAIGDEASAFREYRRYRDVLWNELGAVPALSLEEIFQGRSAPYAAADG